MALSATRMAALIGEAKRRIIYAAPGIQLETAKAITDLIKREANVSLTISLDFDDKTLRMGYGSFEGVEILRDHRIATTHSPGLRSGILIVDCRGWVFTPTALYLEQEPQSDETPNAVRLSDAQIKELTIRLSPESKEEAMQKTSSPEERAAIEDLKPELGIEPIAPKHFESVQNSIKTAPPVKFDVVRQVRVFVSYLQYVELTLTGAAMQRHRVRIPTALQNLGVSKILEGKLKTTFDLIEKGSALSSSALEKELQQIRKNFTPSLGKDHGRVVLKSAKPRLKERIAELQKKLEAHQKMVAGELQKKLDESRKQIIDYYVPLATNTPPDAILGSILSEKPNECEVRKWIDEEIGNVFPRADNLIRKMTLEERYKDVTFETLNQSDFLDCVKKAFPRVDWDKAHDEFLAAGQTAETGE